MEQFDKYQQNTNPIYFNTQIANYKEFKTVAIAKHPELLYQHILSTNTQAQFFFKRKDYQESLDKLKKAEKILQYVAQSCKNIRKELIIVILNNLACLSQMLWDLRSAADYLQAIIFNFSINSLTKSELKNNHTTIISSILSEQMIDNFEDDMKLAEYNLKYCAICSSLARHKNGLVAARKSLKIFLHYINNLQMQEKNKECFEGVKDKSFFDKLNSFKNCIQKKKIFNNQSRRNNFIGWLYSWHKKESPKNQESSHTKYFNALYLGDVMSLSFQALDSVAKKQTQTSPLHLFLLTSISYFSIATEIKILSQNQDESKQNFVYFYFMALATYLLLIPYQSPFLNFLIENYIAANGKSFSANTQIKVSLDQIDEFLKNKQEQGGILPQQSVTTPEMHRRKNLRTDQQSLKLKKIIENKGFIRKNHSTKTHSFDKKIKSLSTSTNQSKKDINQDRHLNMLKSNNTSRKYEPELKYQVKKTNKKDHKAKKADKYDDLGEKYFQMAFKKVNSPEALLQKRKQSGITESSTKDHSSSEKVAKISTKKAINCKQSKYKK